MLQRSRWMVALLALSLGTLTAACGDDDAAPQDDDDGSGGMTAGTGGGGQGGSAEGGGGGMLPFTLTSTAFSEGETWPLVHECGPPLVAEGPGGNVSPPLSWTPGPAETQSYAIVMRDLIAGNLVHWVIFDIPATVFALPEGIPQGHLVSDPAGAKQAEIQMVVHSYFGPCSPDSDNTYQLTVHALDVPTLPGVDMTSQENDVADLIEGMSLASASLSGTS